IAHREASTKAKAERVTEKTDRMDVSQSKLVMGFRIGELESQEEKNAAKLMVALYGGTPFSRLFLNVREKYSLCYYCAARLDKATGTMLVDSGVEAANKQKAQDEILNQLDVVRNGEFTDEELDNTILALTSALGSVTDTLGGMEGWYLDQILSGSSQSPEENARQISSLTREQVMEAAGKVTLDTVYFLTGREENAHESN
ncbi:insulinase family protein, partial [Ligaoa zhengdingensis]